MNDIIKSIEAEQLKENVPVFNVGDTVKVYGKIKEGNRERIQVFEGTVLKKQGGSARATFTVRKFSNGVGVEKTWPLHSPNVEKVEVVRRGKVRRAKLYYLRDRVGKAAKVKELVRSLETGEGTNTSVLVPAFLYIGNFVPYIIKNLRGMRTRAKRKFAAGDRARRENVPDGHMFYKITEYAGKRYKR